MSSTFHYLLFYVNVINFSHKTVDNKSQHDLVSQAIAILKLVLNLMKKTTNDI